MNGGVEERRNAQGCGGQPADGECRVRAQVIGAGLLPLEYVSRGAAGEGNDMPSGEVSMRGLREQVSQQGC